MNIELPLVPKDRLVFNLLYQVEKFQDDPLAFSYWCQDVYRVLDKYRDCIGDEIWCGMDGVYAIPVIEQLQRMGFKVVPFVGMGDREFGDSRMEDWSKLCNPLSKQVSSSYQEWLDWLSERKDEFPAISLSHHRCNEALDRTHFQHVFQGLSEPDLCDYKSLLDSFDFPRININPLDVNLERDAWKYRDDLSKAVILGLLRTRRVPFASVMCGWWCLYDSMAQRNRIGYSRNTDNTGNGSWVDPASLGTEYPFEYWRAYIGAMRFYSGIGYVEGARDYHHLSRLVGYGYEKALAFYPMDHDENVFEGYLTDVREWREKR